MSRQHRRAAPPALLRPRARAPPHPHAQRAVHARTSKAPHEPARPHAPARPSPPCAAPRPRRTHATPTRTRPRAASSPPHACATHPASLTGWLACSQPRPSGGWPVLKPVSNLSSPTCRLKPVVSNRLHPVYTTRWPTCLYNPLATPLFAPCASVLVLTSPRNLTRGRCRPSRGPGQHTQGRGQNTLSPPAEET